MEVEIADNGCGIDEQDMPHLFNPFFTRKKYGTGLGLTQVKKIVDLHQGIVDIFNTRGRRDARADPIPVQPEDPADSSAGGRRKFIELRWE